MTVVCNKHNEKLYQEYLAHRPAGCDFSQINEDHEQFVAATKSFKVIRNRFPYAFWDDQKVSDHLLVVPKEHIESLHSFTSEQAAEYVALLAGYEQGGYHLYARAIRTISRSMTHQHTHLIKGVGEEKCLVIQITKPHILYVRQ